MSNKVVNVRKDEKEPIKEVSKSEAREKLEALIKVYKKQNPKKYELKKDILKEKLNSLK